jgi:hypothetical protein
MSPPGPSASVGKRAALAVLLVAVAGCEGNGSTGPDHAFPARVSLAVQAQATQGGGEATAFDKATAVHIRLGSQGGAALFDQTAPFDPQGETHIPITVVIGGETPAFLQVTLLRNTDALFNGTASLTLIPNDIATADLTLVPVGAAISVPQSLEPLNSLGETRPLPGVVLFVTGDVAESLHLTWTSLTPSVVSVQSDGATSSVVAVGPGQGRLVASYGALSDTVQVLVDIVAASVDVTPATSSIDVSGSVQLSFAAWDAMGNPIANATATWSSDSTVVATVDQNGLVTGHRRGTATISATVDAAVGTATVDVVALRPQVTTESVTDLGVYSATLAGHVNPNLTPTTAWFEWGTDPALSSPSQTSPVDLGSGSTSLAISQPLSGLNASTTYYFRAMASNDGGTQAGAIASFTTLALVAPTVTAQSPTSVGATSATMAGTVNPLGTAATAWFEWGTDPTMGKYTATASQDMGAGTTAVSIEQLVSGLTPDGQTAYYYRVAAQNAAPGTSRSSVITFTTTPTAPSSLSGGFDGPLYINWTDNSSSETYFQIERSTSSTSGFSVTGTSPANSPYYSEGGPFPGNPMYYRVRACSAAGCSAPSNVLTVIPSAPSISGYLYLCYSAGTGGCTYIGDSTTVTLSGPVNATYRTDIYGYYYFSGLPQGTYTVSVADTPCYANFRVNQQSLTFGWGYVQMNFYADTVICGALASAPEKTGEVSPAMARLLGLDDSPSKGTGPPRR